MISIQHKTGSDHTSIEAWLATLQTSFPPDGVDRVRRACDLAGTLYAGQTDLTGTTLLQHALGTASLLVAMNMDHETVCAAILHALPEYRDDWREILEADFGIGVKALIEGISRMEKSRLSGEIRASGKKEKEDHPRQMESLRKMLLAMVQDIRVVLIELAARTQTMRCLSGAPAHRQRQIAEETHNLFAPLANRLGVWQLKWELEDLSIRYLEPELYKKIANLLDERRVDREQYIADVVSRLRQALDKAGIPAEVTGRPKHIYSIINKMKRKQLDFGELYDVRAVRILVGGPADEGGIDGIRECYTALSLVHELWPPIESEFDDYIANPKSNDYRSLHTAVIGPRGLALEVQIRTREMHHHSELGVAAHWRYKEGAKSDARFDEKIAWLRQILAWKDDLSGTDMPEQFRDGLFHDRVYVFTPQGKVIDLPRGATPVDFAYALHTDLGHRTRGAKVDGSIVPLGYQLQNGQRVEILSAKQGAPSRDWLNPSLGFLHSSRARAKVRNWFRSQNLDESIAQGRTQLDKELHRLGVVSINQEKLAQRLHFNKLEDFLAAIGRNEVSSRRIADAIREESPAQVPAMPRPLVAHPPAGPARTADIAVGGVNNLMTRIAKCCNPTSPDAIAGYITRDRGITIHRQDCPFLQRLKENRPDRALSAKWE